MELTDNTPWYRQRWPWLLMLGPAIVVVGGVRLGIVAYSSQDAMVVDDYYKQGKAINMDLRRDRAASALGLAFEARYDARQGTLAGTLTPVAAPFKLYLAHDTMPERDRQVDVFPDAQGRFEVALPQLDKARWRVSVEGGGRAWRLAGLWHYPQEPDLRIRAD